MAITNPFGTPQSMVPTNPSDSLSQQLNVMNDAFRKNPTTAQKMAQIPAETMETLVAKRVVNEFAKQKRQLQEETFVGRTGNPNSTVNDDLKMKGVQLSQDLTNLETDKARAVGNFGRQQEMQKQNALNRLGRPSTAGGIGAILNNPNAAPAPTRGGVPRGGVPALAANNMRNMPPGGIAPPMARGAPPMARGARGGLVTFAESGLAKGEEVVEEVGGEESVVGETPLALGGSGSTEQMNFINELLRRSKQETEDERDRITKSFEDKGGIFSDELIARLAAFGGARSFSEGATRSAAAGQSIKDARRDEINKLLGEVSKSSRESDRDILAAAANVGTLGLGEDTLSQRNTEHLDRLGLDKLRLNQEDTQFILGLRLKADEFDRTLAFKVTDANTKAKIEHMKARVDRAYKQGMLKISEMGEKNTAKQLAIQLAQQQDNYLSNAGALMLGGGVEGDDLVRQVEDLMDTFILSAKEVTESAKPVTDTTIAPLPKTPEKIPEDQIFKLPERAVGIPNMPVTSTVNANAQKLTNQVLEKENKKKRGGIASL